MLELTEIFSNASPRRIFVSHLNISQIVEENGRTIIWTVDAPIRSVQETPEEIIQMIKELEEKE